MKEEEGVKSRKKKREKGRKEEKRGRGGAEEKGGQGGGEEERGRATTICDGNMFKN